MSQRNDLVCLLTGAEAREYQSTGVRPSCSLHRHCTSRIARALFSQGHIRGLVKIGGRRMASYAASRTWRPRASGGFTVLQWVEAETIR